MKNAGSENSIKITDSFFEDAKERAYLELFERITDYSAEAAEQLRITYPKDSGRDAVTELLELLGDIETPTEVNASMKQGATYKQLAYIGHLAKLDSAAPDARQRWYDEARDIGLTKRHAGHIIARLNEISKGTAELEEYVNNAEC
jgi:hypothetical protein